VNDDRGFGFALALAMFVLLVMLVSGHAGPEVNDSYNTYEVCVGFCWR
jgi:hypothetical protein